jgi:DNA helicase-2/ATP-dependent DNA helicase PcrA
MDHLKGLNPAQLAAVEATDGPNMVIAGAGSGKTRVLTVRIAHLITKDVDAFRILALTFTNKAAKEMKERIAKLLYPSRADPGSRAEARNLWMGTFHSVFAKILRAEADKLGYPKDFTIYDTDDSRSLIRTIVKEMQLDDKLYKPNLVHGRISISKNNLIGPKRIRGRCGDDGQRCRRAETEDRARSTNNTLPAASAQGPWISTTCSSTPTCSSAITRKRC